MPTFKRKVTRSTYGYDLLTDETGPKILVTNMETNQLLGHYDLAIGSLHLTIESTNIDDVEVGLDALRDAFRPLALEFARVTGNTVHGDMAGAIAVPKDMIVDMNKPSATENQQRRIHHDDPTAVHL